ncbi:MAG: hypothetical protein Q8R18_03530 [bacterium]|nr:hypothetical protein [bacterium]
MKKLLILIMLLLLLPFVVGAESTGKIVCGENIFALDQSGEYGYYLILAGNELTKDGSLLKGGTKREYKDCSMVSSIDDTNLEKVTVIFNPDSEEKVYFQLKYQKDTTGSLLGYKLTADEGTKIELGGPNFVEVYLAPKQKVSLVDKGNNQGVDIQADDYDLETYTSTYFSYTKRTDGNFDTTITYSSVNTDSILGVGIRNSQLFLSPTSTLSSTQNSYFLLNGYYLVLTSKKDVVRYNYEDKTLEVTFNKQSVCNFNSAQPYFLTYGPYDPYAKNLIGKYAVSNSNGEISCNTGLVLSPNNYFSYGVTYIDEKFKYTVSEPLNYSYIISSPENGEDILFKIVSVVDGKNSYLEYPFLLNKDDVLVLNIDDTLFKGNLILKDPKGAVPIQICGKSQYSDNSNSEYAFGSGTNFQFSLDNGACSINACSYQGVEKDIGSLTKLWCGDAYPLWEISDIDRGQSFQSLLGIWSCYDDDVSVRGNACFAADPVKVTLYNDEPSLQLVNNAFKDLISYNDQYTLIAKRFYVGYDPSVSSSPSLGYLVKADDGEVDILKGASLLFKLKGGEVQDYDGKISYDLEEGDSSYTLDFSKENGNINDPALNWISCCGVKPTNGEGVDYSCPHTEPKTFFSQSPFSIPLGPIQLKNACVIDGTSYSNDKGNKVVSSIGGNTVEVIETPAEAKEVVKDALDERAALFRTSVEQTQNCVEKGFSNDRNVDGDDYYYKCAQVGSYSACEDVAGIGEVDGPYLTSNADRGHWVTNSVGNGGCGTLKSSSQEVTFDETPVLGNNCEQDLVRSNYWSCADENTLMYCLGQRGSIGIWTRSNDCSGTCENPGELFVGNNAGATAALCLDDDVLLSNVEKKNMCYASGSSRAPSLAPEECVPCEDDRECDEGYSCIDGECVGESLQTGSYTCGGCSLEEGKAYAVYKAIIDESTIEIGPNNGTLITDFAYLVTENSDVSTRFLEGFIIDGSDSCGVLDTSDYLEVKIYCPGDEQLFLSAVRDYERSQAPEQEKKSFWNWLIQYKP